MKRLPLCFVAQVEPSGLATVGRSRSFAHCQQSAECLRVRYILAETTVSLQFYLAGTYCLESGLYILKSVLAEVSYKKPDLRGVGQEIKNQITVVRTLGVGYDLQVFSTSNASSMHEIAEMEGQENTGNEQVENSSPTSSVFNGTGKLPTAPRRKRHTPNSARARIAG